MKIAQIIVDGFEDIEAITTIDLLRRADIKIDTIALQNKSEVISAHNITIRCDYLINQVDLNEYDGYILAGGPGYLHYFASEQLKTVLLKANNEKKLIAAICAAPAFLASLGILNSHSATIFPEMSNELNNSEIAYIENKVVVSDNIITGPAVGNALNFALAIIEYLSDTKTMNKIKSSIYY